MELMAALNYKVQLCTRFGTVLEEVPHENAKDARRDIGQKWQLWCHRLDQRGFFSAEVVAARDDLHVVYVKNKCDCLALTSASGKRSKKRFSSVGRCARVTRGR
jgi:hypothetical protein